MNSSSRLSAKLPAEPHPETTGAHSSINLTLHTQGEFWLAALVEREGNSLHTETLRLWVDVLRNWIYPVLGELPISEVRTTTVRSLVQFMAGAGLSVPTIRKYLQALRMVLESLTDCAHEPQVCDWNLIMLDIQRNQTAPKKADG